MHLALPYCCAPHHLHRAPLGWCLKGYLEENNLFVFVSTWFFSHGFNHHQICTTSHYSPITLYELSQKKAINCKGGAASQKSIQGTFAGLQTLLPPQKKGKFPSHDDLKLDPCAHFHHVSSYIVFIGLMEEFTIYFHYKRVCARYFSPLEMTSDDDDVEICDICPVGKSTGNPQMILVPSASIPSTYLTLMWG